MLSSVSSVLSLCIGLMPVCVGMSVCVLYIVQAKRIGSCPAGACGDVRVCLWMSSTSSIVITGRVWSYHFQSVLIVSKGLKPVWVGVSVCFASSASEAYRVVPRRGM